MQKSASAAGPDPSKLFYTTSHKLWRMAQKDRKGEAMIGAVDFMNEAVKGMRYAAQTCNIKDMATHANAFGFYEGILTDLLYETDTKIDQFPDLDRRYSTARAGFVRAQEISQRGCDCDVSKRMKGLSKAIDAEYPTRVEMARRGISEDKEYAAEDRYEMDRMLRRLVFHY